MKPHIKKIDGVWRCYVKRSGFRWVGLGYTPLCAYDDWLVLELRS